MDQALVRPGTPATRIAEVVAEEDRVRHQALAALVIRPENRVIDEEDDRTLTPTLGMHGPKALKRLAVLLARIARK